MKLRVKESVILSDDDCLFICMSLGAAYNQAVTKGAKQLADTVRRRLKSFVFRHLAACKRAASSFKGMNDDERRSFFENYNKTAAIEKEIDM